jgi:hypothetical protein
MPAGMAFTTGGSMATTKKHLHSVKKIIKRELGDIALTIAEKVINDIRDGTMGKGTGDSTPNAKKAVQAVKSPKKTIKKVAKKAMAAAR